MYYAINRYGVFRNRYPDFLHILPTLPKTYICLLYGNRGVHDVVKIDGKYSTSYACHFANSRMKYYIFYIKIQKAFEKFREGCNAFTVLGNQRGSIFMEIIHKSRLFLDVLSQIVRIAGFPECIFFFFYL